MKVLWICNTMLPVVAEYLNKEGSNKEGWLSGLMDAFMKREESKDLTLSVAFPVGKEEDGLLASVPVLGKTLKAYGFFEDTLNPHVYDASLEARMLKIYEEVEPDVIHCFGTEFPHTLALMRVCPAPEKILIGIQGVCQVIEKAYMADLPSEVYEKNSFRDWLKKDGLTEQKKKFAMRGAHEKEILSRAVHVTGRTAYDRFYAKKCQPNVNYYELNETLRSQFYEDVWEAQKAYPHQIFLSQGDYPLKGFHYLLIACGMLKEKYSDVTLKVAGNSLVNYNTLKDKIKISGYGKYLRSLIKHYGLEDRVEILGKLNATRMKQQYLNCGVYVCCSANENSPNSLGEAMLMGVPCVAANVGGVASVFDDRDGVLYEGSNFYLTEDDFGYKDGPKRDMMEIAKNLCEAIDRLWSDPEKAREYCTNARLHAAKTHDGEANFLRTVEIYQRIATKES